MLNPFAEVNWNPDRPARRKFALSLIIGFSCIAIFFSVMTRLASGAWKPFFLWLGMIGCGVGIVLWLMPQIARPFYVAWYFITCCIGFVVGNVLFSAFFYLMVTPMGLLRRMINPRAFRKGFDQSRPTYWEDSRKVVDPKRYYRQF
jgi:hypothetical protein